MKRQIVRAERTFGRAAKVEDIGCRTGAGLAAIFVAALLQRPVRKTGTRHYCSGMFFYCLGEGLHFYS